MIKTKKIKKYSSSGSAGRPTSSSFVTSLIKTKILQYKKPSTFVLATNKTHSVREFVNLAYEEVNIQIEWSGKDQNEIGVDKLTGEKLVVVNPKFYRPTEVEILLGDASKAHEQLNWYPKMELKELASIMVKKDIERNIKGQSF
mgnify:CR=1 FL=1